MHEIVPSRKLIVKSGTQAIGGILGGVAILVLGGLGTVASLVVGGAIAITGLVISRDKEDRLPGTIAAVAGAITAATAIPFVGGIAGTLLSISGIGLLITGGINLFKFLKGYRKRTR